MDKLFPVLPHILSENGVFYLLAVEENKPGYNDSNIYIYNTVVIFKFGIIKVRKVLDEEETFTLSERTFVLNKDY